jgi:hypothetical protein
MRYRLEKSEHPGWWVLTDLEKLIVIKFKEHEFNDTQQVSVLDDEALIKKAQDEGYDVANYMAHAMQEIGQYMYDCHYSITFPTPVHEIRYSENYTKMEVIRHKFPKFRIEVEDDCSIRNLGTSVRNAGEFLRHQGRCYE